MRGVTKTFPTPSTRIREVRKARGMTLKELAQAVGTTPQTVQRLETANMTVSMKWLERFAKIFGLGVHQLLPHAADVTTPDGLFIQKLADAVIRNRRTIPDINDVLPSLVESLGRLSGLMLECRKGLRPWDDANEQALDVAAAAMRIGVDGRALAGAVKLGEAA